MEVYCSTFPLVGRLVGAPRPFHEGGPEEDCRSQLSFPFWTGDHHTGNRGLCEFPTTDFCVRRGGWEEPINPCPFSSGSWQRFLLRLVSTLPHLIWVRDGSQIWDQESGCRYILGDLVGWIYPELTALERWWRQMQFARGFPRFSSGRSPASNEVATWCCYPVTSGSWWCDQNCGGPNM